MRLLLLIAAFALSTAPAAEVTFTVLDHATSAPVPARIHLKDEKGAAIKAGSAYPFHKTHFTCPGTATLDLKPGAYTYEIERGPEFSLDRGRFTFAPPAPGQPPLAIEARLERLTNLAVDEGWFSGDLHVHRPVEDMELLMAAEQLHLAPVITWWNQKNLWPGRPIPTDTLVRLSDTQAYDVMGGEDEREGGALLYFHLKTPISMKGASREHPSPMKFLGTARANNPKVWIDVEKPFWWDAPIWIASGQIDSIGIANNHMTREGTFSPKPNPNRTNAWTDEAWGRPRDYDRLPSPQGNGYWSQEIYYQVLNSGLRIPPSAGSASGVLPNPLGYNRVWVHLGPGNFSWDAWWEGLRKGRAFVSNGPLLRVRAGDQIPGHVFKSTQTLTLELDALLDSRERIRAIEVIQNGEVVQSVNAPRKLTPLEFKESSWFLVRAIVDDDDNFRFASTAPWYVEIGETKSRISAASAQFFLDWVRERRTLASANLPDPAQRAEVIAHHNNAESFWQNKLNNANAP